MSITFGGPQARGPRKGVPELPAVVVGVPRDSTTHDQGLRPGAYPRPSNRVLGRVLGTLKYLDTYSSNAELSTLVPGTYSSVPTDPIYLRDTYPST
jgi:hypothetical protein